MITADNLVIYRQFRYAVYGPSSSTYCRKIIKSTLTTLLTHSKYSIRMFWRLLEVSERIQQCFILVQKTLVRHCPLVDQLTSLNNNLCPIPVSLEFYLPQKVVKFNFRWFSHILWEHGFRPPIRPFFALQTWSSDLSTLSFFKKCIWYVTYSS